MTDLDLILWGIVIVASIGLVCTVVKSISDIELSNLKLRLMEEEQLLRLRAQSAVFMDFSKLKRTKNEILE